MTKWKRTLDLSDLFAAWSVGTVTVQELAGKVFERLKALESFSNDNSSGFDLERLDIAECFREMSGDRNTTPQEFDVIMGELYDWGDTLFDRCGYRNPRVCRIVTKPQSLPDRDQMTKFVMEA